MAQVGAERGMPLGAAACPAQGPALGAHAPTGRAPACHVPAWWTLCTVASVQTGPPQMGSSVRLTQGGPFVAPRHRGLGDRVGAGPICPSPLLLLVFKGCSVLSGAPGWRDAGILHCSYVTVPVWLGWGTPGAPS